MALFFLEVYEGANIGRAGVRDIAAAKRDDHDIGACRRRGLSGLALSILTLRYDATDVGHVHLPLPISPRPAPPRRVRPRPCPTFSRLLPAPLRLGLFGISAVVGLFRPFSARSSCWRRAVYDSVMMTDALTTRERQRCRTHHISHTYS